jgi:hypothetical protein
MTARNVLSLLFACALFGGTARADRDDSDELPPGLPAALQPPAGEEVAFDAIGRGVQVYSCNFTGGVYGWAFVAPAATLRDDGRTFAIHYGGPTWQSTSDGSTVVGKALVKVPSPLPGTVPWLLLTAVSHTGGGLFSHVTSIQRLETVGGAAPATGCDGAHAGVQVGVAYRAHYFFYKLAGDQFSVPQGGDED